MRRIRQRWVFSHLAVVVLGLSLGLTMSRRAPEPEGKSKAEADGSGSGAEATGAAMSGKAVPESAARTRPAGAESTTGLKAADFRRAWKELAGQRLTMDERQRQQQMLLEAWAEIDLAGALDAAVAESWTDGSPYIPGHWALTEAFSKAFRARPEESWELLASGRYGLAAQMLREQWIFAASLDHGPLVLAMLPHLPESLQTKAAESAMRYGYQSPERLAELLRALQTLPPGPEQEKWTRQVLTGLPDGGDPAVQRGEWLAAPEGQARTIGRMSWAASLRRADADTLRAEWAALPAAERGAAADALLSQAEWRSPGMKTMFALAIEAEQWDSIARLGGELVTRNANSIGAGELRDWAMSLPERAETAGVFRESVAPLMRQNLTEAREWLETLEPGGWQRDQVLAEYAQQVVQRQKDDEAVRWALEQITDPAVRSAAGNWQAEHRRQEGQRRFAAP